MIIEEKEAHDMQCARNPSASFCFGSRCMAWRWHVKEKDVPGVVVIRQRSTTHGYCGLAGELRSNYD